MERIEYRNVIDKSQWGDGPWQSEPDKIQWQDEATGLPCLIVRGPVGALCGYVGVPKTHPAYGLHYDGCTTEAANEWRKESRKRMRKAALNPTGPRVMPDFSDMPEQTVVPGAGEAVVALEAHGGITFADKCSDISLEAWERWRKRLLARNDEAQQYPVGDAAQAFKEWEGCINNYEAWAERARSRYICHHDPENDDVWWFGFDCAHAWDICPGIDYTRTAGTRSLSDSTYRDVAYVTKECEGLAAQLQELVP